MADGVSAMIAIDVEVQRLCALQAIRSNLLRLKWLSAATRFEIALCRHHRALKAGFNPDQPRVPAGNREGGQWADENGNVTQSLTTASDQVARRDLKRLQEIANNPIVRRRINQAWEASTLPGKAPQEHGFWISRNATTGALLTRPFANPGTMTGMVPGPVPDDAIAFFHTHPNKSEDGFAQGPSTEDERFAVGRGLSGLIRSHSGMYYFGPPLKK